MNRTANEVIDAYSSLDEKEQKLFDKKYRKLMAFRRQLNKIVKDFTKKKAINKL